MRDTPAEALVAKVPQDLVQTLRGRIRQLQTELAVTQMQREVAKAQLADRDRQIQQLQSSRGQKIQELQMLRDQAQHVATHQGAWTTYYYALYIEAIIAGSRTPYFQFAAMSKGSIPTPLARDDAPPPPRDGAEGGSGSRVPFFSLSPFSDILYLLLYLHR